MWSFRKIDIWEEASAKTRMQEWEKELRPETAAVVIKHEDIQWTFELEFMK
jgi:hypothetical protein